LGLAHKGRIVWNKDKKNCFNKETLEKMKMSHMGHIPWNKDKTDVYSKEALEKMSLAHAGQVPWNKGIPRSEGTKQKLREANKGQIAPNKGIPMKEGTKQKLRETLTGRKNGPHTEKSKQKMSLAKVGHIVTEETKNKIRNTLIDWDFYNEHGCTRKQYPYSSEWTAKLRKQVAERDGYTCQLCSEVLPDRWGTHHIDYDKDNNDPFNLIFLCNYCHNKTNGNRTFWEQYFKQLQNARGFGEGQQVDAQINIDSWN